MMILPALASAVAPKTLLTLRIEREVWEAGAPSRGLWAYRQTDSAAGAQQCTE